MKKYRKRAFLLLTALLLFSGCGNQSGKASNSGSGGTLEESQETLNTIVSGIEAVNTIENPRKIDDFTVESEMRITLDDLQYYGGDVTNNQADCAMVFVALCREGKTDSVCDQLEAYRQTLTSTLYTEFADKVEKAKNARILTSGNYALLVMAGIEGVSYEQIDQTLDSVLNP